MFKRLKNGTKFLICLIKLKAEEIFLQTLSMWVFLTYTTRDFVEDTSMVRNGLSDK